MYCWNENDRYYFLDKYLPVLIRFVRCLYWQHQGWRRKYNWYDKFASQPHKLHEIYGYVLEQAFSNKIKIIIQINNNKKKVIGADFLSYCNSAIY